MWIFKSLLFLSLTILHNIVVSPRSLPGKKLPGFVGYFLRQSAWEKMFFQLKMNHDSPVRRTRRKATQAPACFFPPSCLSERISCFFKVSYAYRQAPRGAYIKAFILNVCFSYLFSPLFSHLSWASPFLFLVLAVAKRLP